MQKQDTSIWRRRIDHLALAAPTLSQGVEYVEDLLGVSVQPGGKHPAWGTQNALIALGPQVFLEVIAPDPDRHDPALPSLFGIDRLSAPKLNAWAVRENQLETRLEQIRQAGIRFGAQLDGQRKRPDGAILRWRLSDPLVRLGQGVIPFLIDWGNTPHPAGQMPQECTLVDLRIEYPNAEEIAKVFRLLDLEDVQIDAGPKPTLVATIQTPAGLIELR